MNRTLTNFVIDLLAAILLLGMLATGWILSFPLPPGTNKTYVLWGLARHQWGSIHAWISLGLLTGLAIHVVMHWSWISNVIAKQLRTKGDTTANRRRWGVVSLLLFVLLFSTFAWMTNRSVQPVDSANELESAGIAHLDRQSHANEAAPLIVSTPFNRLVA